MIVCAVVMLALLAFTYVGYPAVIGALARLAPVKAAAPDGRGDAGVAAAAPPLVSICLPVSDGASFLAAKIESLLAQDYPAERIEILMYCDGCRDDSVAMARALAAEPRAAGRISVIAAAERLGKPTGINALAAAARGELLLFNDVRQPLSPGATRALAAAMADPAVGCATGELVLAGGAGSGVYWKYERWIRGQESRFRGVVGMTGAIAMMRRAEFTPLPEGTILDDVLMPMRLVLAGKRVALIGDAKAFDAAFEDDREFRRKVRTLTGNYQLFAMMPALLLPWRNPIWFETVSHKILRLLAPWFMVALLLVSLAATAAGRGGVWPLLLAAQIGFYVAAAVGRRAGPIGGLARTFVVLNAAAVIGLWRFVRGGQRVTW
jgi:cellulose synthase/poly-beta-1,6-N-acetylglucosamine synthase-like glycosyltransferase